MASMKKSSLDREKSAPANTTALEEKTSAAEKTEPKAKAPAKSKASLKSKTAAKEKTASKAKSAAKSKTSLKEKTAAKSKTGLKGKTTAKSKTALKTKAAPKKKLRRRGPSADRGTYERILKAATALFAQQSFSAVSIKDIAAAGYVNGALIYYYFGDKKELYQTVLNRQSDALARIMEELDKEELSPIDKLHRYVLALARFQEEQPHCLHLIYRELVSPQPIFPTFVRSRLYRVHTFMSELVEGSIGREALGSSVRPTHVAFTVEGIIMFYFLMKKYVAELGNFAPGEELQYLLTALNGILDSLPAAKKDHETAR